MTNFHWPWTPIQWATILAQIFVLETRWSPASIEPLIDLVASMEPKEWRENPSLLKNQKIAENALSRPLAEFRLAIASRQNMLKRYSNPRNTRGIL